MIIKIILIQHQLHRDFEQMLNNILNSFQITDNRNIFYIINFKFLNRRK